MGHPLFFLIFLWRTFDDGDIVYIHVFVSVSFFGLLTLIICATVNNLPMGYPLLQPPPIPATGQPHLDSMSHGISSCHVVNGVPAPSNFQPMRMNSGNE